MGILQCRVADVLAERAGRLRCSLLLQSLWGLTAAACPVRHSPGHGRMTETRKPRIIPSKFWYFDILVFWYSIPNANTKKFWYFDIWYFGIGAGVPNTMVFGIWYFGIGTGVPNTMVFGIWYFGIGD